MSKIDLGMDFQMPKNQSSQIKVMGIGGGGSNAVNYMFENGITGVDFVISFWSSGAMDCYELGVPVIELYDPQYICSEHSTHVPKYF